MLQAYFNEDNYAKAQKLENIVAETELDKKVVQVRPNETIDGTVGRLKDGG